MDRFGPEHVAGACAIALVIGWAIWLFAIFFPGVEADAGGKEAMAPRSDRVHVVRVIDGATIAVTPSSRFPATDRDGTEHVVHLRGIQVPDLSVDHPQMSSCGAQESADHLADLIGGSDTVALRYTPNELHADRFGETTAYVDLGGGSKGDLGRQQIRSGYANAWYPQDEHRPSRWGEYKTAERRAIADQVGARALCAGF